MNLLELSHIETAIQDGEIIFWEDPGHGWLQVPVAIIESLQQKGMKVTPYSYQDDNYVYLEEDCDETEFFRFTGLNYKETIMRIPRRYKENLFIRNLKTIENIGRLETEE